MSGIKRNKQQKQTGVRTQRSELSVASLVLYDSRRRILLQHRTDDALYYPGFWAFFGGRIEEGEAPEEAVCREAIEELDFQVKSPAAFNVYDIQTKDFRLTLHVFLNPLDRPKRCLKLLEGKGWGWFAPQQLTTLKTVPHDRGILRDIFTSLGWSEQSCAFLK